MKFKKKWKWPNVHVSGDSGIDAVGNVRPPHLACSAIFSPRGGEKSEQQFLK
ncbi:MAG: hypothetical protein KDA88_20815 [Planctomycetaceae bacterium]|nr:hypothetical protein [Planctomycetaceae bacterium]MCB9953494.1 hypothetical protein [Planctomycetaceae bacterium]